MRYDDYLSTPFRKRRGRGSKLEREVHEPSDSRRDAHTRTAYIYSKVILNFDSIVLNWEFGGEAETIVEAEKKRRDLLCRNSYEPE